MFVKALHIALPRRVTAYFLLFGLAAVVWLGAGVFYISSAVVQSQSTGAILATMGQASHRLALKYLHTGSAELQGEIEDLQRQNRFAYSAIVAPDGQNLCHSSPEEVGRAAAEPAGEVETWGDIERVRFVNEQGVLVAEYRAPLRAGSRRVGSLRVAVTEPSPWTAVLNAAQYGPLAVLGPLMFMGIGAIVLQRLVRPVADIEGQLRKAAVAPSILDCALQEVDVCGAASVGWNRIVERHATAEQGADLRERLSQSLEGVRHKKLAGILNCLSEGVLTSDRQGVLTYHNLSAVALLERRQRTRPETKPGSGDSTKETSESDGKPTAGDPAPVNGEPEGNPLHATSLVGDRLVDWLRRKWVVPPDCPLLQEGTLERTVVVELERTGEGERRVLRVTRTPLRGGDAHDQDSHVWTLRDVTQQKLAEEMRNQFVDTATHELRTPLASIKAYAETLALQDIVDTEQQKEFLNIINIEATRLARFVDDLLSVSSMEIGSLSLSRQPTDLERLFTGVVGKVKPQMVEKNITFETQFPEKWPEPELDKEKFAATIVNLLGNATKYTPEGGRVGLRVKINDGQLEISVEDTGIGISQEDIPRLFDKFFRSGDPRVTDVTGTGLGLSLAYEVIRLHGGKITVDSELNKGSTFLVTVPL